MTSRFERFSEDARRALSIAKEESQRLNHNYIGTEHLLLGLLRGTGTAAAQILSALSVDPAQVRSRLEEHIKRSEQRPSPREIGLDLRVKRAIELAVDEARRLDHQAIGTEHLLVGLLRVGEGVATETLTSLGVKLDGVRSHLNAVPPTSVVLGQADVAGPLVARKQAGSKVAGLYVIVDPELTQGRSIVEITRAALRGGAAAIQLRDKVHDKGDQLPIARQLRDLCEEHDAVFIVNDHADLAVASNAHGLHVGQHDLPVHEARRILQAHQFIGTSNALLQEAHTSLAQGADYIAVGAMYDTTSKGNTRPAGIEALRQVRQAISDVPIVAIGGINLSNVDPVLEGGADGICVIGAVCMAADPEGAARSLVKRINAHRKAS